MSLSDATRPTSGSKPKIWREIRARLSAIPNEPPWLPAGQRYRRRLCHLLIAELLRDQRMPGR